jgi:hypothetical protein
MQTSSDTGHTDTGPLVPAREVLKRYGVVDRTLDRWVADPKLGFPQPTIINKRRYFRENALLEWERHKAKAQAVSA